MEGRETENRAGRRLPGQAVALLQGGLLVLFFVSMLYLRWQQFDTDNYATGLFWSDNREHLEMALSGYNYSLNSILFRLLYGLAGAPGCVALVFAFDVLGIWAARRLLGELIGRSCRGLALLALACCMAAPFCPGLDGEIFRGSFGGALYFNVTYSEMRAFAFLALADFLPLYRQWETGVPPVRWLRTTLWIFLATTCKASFVFVFAPVLLMMLVWDLVRTRGRNLKREIQLGCMVLPSVAACLVEASVLFSDAGSGLAFAPLLEMSYWSEHYLFDVVRTYLFPLTVLVCFGRRLLREQSYRIFWGLGGMAVAQALLLADVSRAAAGNMSWGACFATVLLYLVSVASLVRIATSRERCPGRLVLCTAVFACHLATGIVYWIQRLGGAGI